MLEVGWSEMLVIAIVMIVVVGPKDLPRMLRTFGQMTAKMRGMANDFRKQFDEAMKEAELDDLKKTVDTVRSMNPAGDLKKALNPMEKAAAEVRAGLDAAFKPAPKPEPAAGEAHPAEPLKNGAAAMPEAVAQAPAAPAPAPVAEAKPAPAKPAPAKKAATPKKAPVKAPVKAPAKTAGKTKAST